MDRDAKYLNKLLQGEMMGIELYEKYISKVSSSKEKESLKQFLEQHRQHKSEIINILSSKGEKVSGKVGVVGNTTQVLEEIKLMFKKKPKDIVRKVYRGEIMGLTYTKKYLQEFSESLRPEIEKLIQEDTVRIEKIHDLLIKM